MQLKEETNKLKLGILSKTLCGFLIIFYIVSYFNKNFNLIYGNITLFILGNFEIYRIITGFFISESLIELILNISVIYTIINYYENYEGTTKFSVKFGINIIAFQLFILAIQIFLYFIYPIIISYYIKPIPALGVAYLVKHVLMTENKEILIYKDNKASNRWLLIIIFLVFIILNLTEFKVEIIVSLYYGFLMCKMSKLLNYNLNEDTVLLFEKNDSYKFLVGLSDWVAIENSLLKKNVKKINIDTEVMDLHDDSLREDNNTNTNIIIHNNDNDNDNENNNNRNNNRYVKDNMNDLDIMM
jgi:hypothetical protein